MISVMPRRSSASSGWRALRGPEYEACARIAREQGLPLSEVYRIVQRAADERLA